MTLEKIIEELIRYDGQELMLIGGHFPMMKKIDCWHPLSSTLLSLIDCQKMCFDILNDEDKKQVESKRSLTKMINFQNKLRLKAHFFYQSGFLSVQMKQYSNFIPEFSEKIDPEIFSGLTQQPYGLVLITGCPNQGKTSLLFSLLDEINKKFSRSMGVFNQVNEYFLKSQKSVLFQVNEGDDLKGNFNLIRHKSYLFAEVFSFDIDDVLISLPLSVQLADEGRMVFCVVPGTGVLDLLEKSKDILHNSSIFNRFCKSLHAVISLTKLPNIQGTDFIYANEFLLATPHIRDYLIQNQFEDIDLFLRENENKKTGLSLNHSLFGLVTSGMLELSQAFKISRDPNQLNLMLSKVGF